MKPALIRPKKNVVVHNTKVNKKHENNCLHPFTLNIYIWMR